MKDFFENLLNNGELQEKVAELKAYKDVNEDFKTAWEELKAENDRLKEEIKEVKKYQYQQEYLDKEIERLKTQYNCYACGNCNGKEDYINLEKHHKGLRKQFEKYYHQTLDDEIKLNELYQTLQEIKTIATRAFAVCDDDCGNANRFKEIIELTKAEEE